MGLGLREETDFPALCAGLPGLRLSRGRRKVLNLNGIWGFKITLNGSNVLIRTGLGSLFYESDRKNYRTHVLGAKNFSTESVEWNVVIKNKVHSSLHAIELSSFK